MDVVEFFSEFRRMCKSTSDCTKCEYHGDKCDNAIELFEKTVAMVEQWSKKHPHKTRQSVFLEQWPNCMMDDDGIVGMCLDILGYSAKDIEVITPEQYEAEFGGDEG